MTAHVDLDALVRLAEAATPGPWHSLGWQVGSEVDGFLIADALRDPEATVGYADAAHIAAASPDVVLALVERVRAAEAALDEAEFHIQQLTASRDRAERALESAGTVAEQMPESHRSGPRSDEGHLDDPLADSDPQNAGNEGAA